MRNLAVARLIGRWAIVSNLLLVVNLTTSFANAQSFYGEVRGIVKDPNGAGVANANVSLADQSQGTVRTSVTSRTGEYAFGDVIPATYSISVSAAGFKKAQHRDVTVSTQQRVALDLTLE